MQTHNYTLILFQKDAKNIPKLYGQKAIPEWQYKELINPIFKEFTVGDTLFQIIERRYFSREDSICVNFYIVIDGMAV